MTINRFISTSAAISVVILLSTSVLAAGENIDSGYAIIGIILLIAASSVVVPLFISLNLCAERWGEKMTYLSLSVRRMVVRILFLFAAFISGMVPVWATQVVEEHGTVYSEMTSVEQVCSFLGSPALSLLADLQPLDRDAYDQSFREFSASMSIWLQVKTKSVGLDDGVAAYPSSETRTELRDRFTLCFALHSNDQRFLRVLNVLFDNRNYPPMLSFLRPYFGKPIMDLEALVFMASMKDGNEYLVNYLKSTERLLASRVATARQNQVTQSPAAPTENGPSPDELGDALDSVLGGTPVYAQYTCEISGSEVLGVPNFNGRDKIVRAEIGVKSDGTAIINGKLVPPMQVVPATAGTDLPFKGVAYRALDVRNALFSTEGLGPGLLNPSQQELQDFEKLKGIVDGLENSLLAGRTRVLGVSLANDTIFLTDITPDGELVNRNTPRCSKTP